MRQHFFYSLVFLVVLGCCKEPQQPNTANTPETIWKTPLSTGAETVSMNPVFYKDLIVYCANDGSALKSKLVALNRNTGKLVWEYRYNDYEVGDFSISDSYLHNNTLVFPVLGGDNRRIVGINLDNGTRMWQNLEQGIRYELQGYKDKFYSLRLLDRGTKSDIMVGDVNTGNLQILYSVSQNNAPAHIEKMNVYDDVKGHKCLAFLIATSENFSFQRINYRLVKYNLDSNKVAYEKQLDYLDPKANYWLNGYQNGKFWLNSIGTYFYALDEQTGTEALKILIPTSNQTGVMSLADGKVFISTEQTVYGYDANSGTRLWREEGTSGGSTSRQLYHNGVLYFTSRSNGKFHAIDGSTGKSIYHVVSPDKKGNGQGGFDTAIALDTVNKRIYTATYFSAICYKMPK